MAKEMAAKLRKSLLRLLAPAPIAIWLVGSLSVSLAGPFGTFEALPYLLRLMYWGSLIGLSIVTGVLVRTFCLSRISPEEPIKHDILSIAALTVIFSPIAFLLSVIFLTPFQPVPPGISEVAFYVAAISAAVFIIRRLTSGAKENPHMVGPAAKPLPQILRRLPDDFVGPIVRISVRDHFVDVVTTRQTTTIRMRFGDAINEMAGVLGYCTHRSHWVVADAIEAVQQDGGKTSLRLINGDVVPVSRKYHDSLKDSGVI